MTDSSPSPFRFGDCELDVAARQLTRAGEPIGLQPKVFSLLAYLVEHRDRAVDKDELQDAIWAPMIVTETALTRAIMKARRAIGDDADRQALIRTVHGHGYQFIGDLDSVAPDEPESATPSAATETAETRVSTDESPGKTRWPWGLAAGLLAAIIAFVLLRPANVPVDGLRLAVLPVHNATADPEFDWVRYGLMDLSIGLFSQDDAIDVVATSDIVAMVENLGLQPERLDASLADIQRRLERTFGVTHVLLPELARNVGGLRLNYVLVDRDGRRRQATMVSDQSSLLARGMVQGVAGLLGVRRFDDGTTSSVDSDPFINEAYARAMSTTLEGRCGEAVPLFDIVLARNPALHRARLERADCLFGLGRVDEAETALRALSKDESIRRDLSLYSETLQGLGKLLHESGRLAEADATYGLSLEAAQTADDRDAEGKVLISMAIRDYRRRDFAAARDKLSRATLSFRSLEREVLPGEIYATLANINMTDGQFGDAEDAINQALESFRTLGDRAGEARMLNNYGYLRRLQGRDQEAETLHEQSLAMRRELGDRVGQGRILGMLSVLYVRSGRYEQARDAAQESIEIAREAKDRLFTATGLAQLAEADRLLGNADDAASALIEAGDIFVSIEDLSRAAQVDLRLAQLYIQTREFDLASARIDQVLTQSLAADWINPAVEAMQFAGDLERARENLPLAAEWYERAIAHALETGHTAGRIGMSIRLAHVYLDLGQLEAVEPLLGFLVEQETSESIDAVRERYESMRATATGS